MASGFLDKLRLLFAPSNDSEAVKKRRIKQLGKDLSKNKYSRYFKVKTGEIDSPLGKLLYDIYKIISPAQVFLQNASKSAQLKQIVVETFFDKNLEEIRQRLAPETIEEKLKTGYKDLGQSLNADFAMLGSALGQDKIESIDRCYNNILAMAQFVAFDFFYVLKKFDSKITERNFTYQPKFLPVRGEYLREELKDFMDVAFCLDPDMDWKNALTAVKVYKNGVDVVATGQWNKLLLLLRDIKKSGIFELMIRYIEQKPDWTLKPKFFDEHITENYLEHKQAEIKIAINKALNAKKNAQIYSLTKTIFGSTEIKRAKYYTETNSEIYVKKNFEGFIYAYPINYLKAFLLEYFKKDLRELFDLMLIRGQWTDLESSRRTSEHFHRLLDISDKLSAFDESMGDTGENGSRLKTSIGKADRDKNQARYVTVILKTVNGQALELMKASAVSLIILGKSLKMLSDDLLKPSRELILNWKELEGVSERLLAQRISDAYKKIYYFVQLMQLFSGSSAGEKKADSEGSMD